MNPTNAAEEKVRLKPTRVVGDDEGEATNEGGSRSDGDDSGRMNDQKGSIVTTRSRLRDLGEAGIESWRRLKTDVRGARNQVDHAFKQLATRTARTFSRWMNPRLRSESVCSIVRRSSSERLISFRGFRRHPAASALRPGGTHHRSSARRGFERCPSAF
jgi:hypothetical protein